MRRVVPGIDIDGVLADFVTALNDLAFRVTGKHLQNPPLTWNYQREPGGLTPEEESKLWGMVQSSGFWQRIRPLASMVEFGRLRKLEFYHPLYFITTRGGDYAKWETEEWLRGQDFHNPTVLISPNKGPVARGLGLTHFLDDKPENCLDVWKESPETKVYLLDATYNQHPECFKLAGYPPIRRVFSVLEWIGIVETDEDHIELGRAA